MNTLLDSCKLIGNPKARTQTAFIMGAVFLFFFGGGGSGSCRCVRKIAKNNAASCHFLCLKGEDTERSPRLRSRFNTPSLGADLKLRPPNQVESLPFKAAGVPRTPVVPTMRAPLLPRLSVSGWLAFSLPACDLGPVARPSARGARGYAPPGRPRL